MNKRIVRAFALILTLITMVGLLTVPALAASTTRSVKTATLPLDKGHYVVTSSSALVCNGPKLITGFDCELDRDTPVKVTGSSGSYYQIDMNGTTRYIYKSALKKASSVKGEIYYTTAKAPIRPLPFEGKTVKTVAKGTPLLVVGNVLNSKGNTWRVVYDDGALYYVYAGNVKKASQLSVKITGDTNRVNTLGTLQLKAAVSPSAITAVRWSSSNTKVATVDQNGLVRGIRNGEATITVTVGEIFEATYPVTVTQDVKLDVKPVRQSKNYTCSAASTLAVLHYYGKDANTKDTTLYKDINGYVYAIRNALNKRLGKTYAYKTYKSVDAYRKDIYNSLAQGSPVIARVAFPKEYFNYSSKGHYTTIVGMYTDSKGEVWLQLADSFTDRYKDNSYTDADAFTVKVPLKTLYKYGTYGGKSDIYLIYNP